MLRNIKGKFQGARGLSSRVISHEDGLIRVFNKTIYKKNLKRGASKNKVSDFFLKFHNANTEVDKQRLPSLFVFI